MNDNIVDNRLVARLAAEFTGTDIFLTHGSNEKQLDAQLKNPALAEANKEYYESEDRLHGSPVSRVPTINEKPIHRMMIWLHAAGASIDDIASQTGYTRVSVSTILRQPWARSRLVQILKENGQDQVKHFLNSEVRPSLEVLREIRDGNYPAQARISATKEILDRALGKSTIHVESETKVTNVPAEAARLDAELKAVRAQLESKGVDGLPASN